MPESTHPVGEDLRSRIRRSWSERFLLLLALEKAIQHAVVTWGFSADAGDLRDEVVVDYRWLLVLGALIGVLFLVALLALVQRRSWSLSLLSALALVDIVGEFVAQGTLLIAITVSFVVAVAILVLARITSREDAAN